MPLTLLSDQGTFTPVGAQGGPWNPLRKPLSHRNFAMKFAPYMYALLETIIRNRNKIHFMLHCFKMAAK